MASVLQSRKWQVTINNPEEHGFSTDKIVSILSNIRGSAYYWCFCFEEGDECETRHVHIFLYRKSPFTVEYIAKLFPSCHREVCFGSPTDNRDYILKDGVKFHKDSTGHYSYTDSKGKIHSGINYSDTFMESGDCPEEHQGKSSASETIVELIRQGYDDESIVDNVPSAFKDLDKVQRTRSLFRDSQFKKSWRQLTVTYVFGATGTGKTRSVMEKYGYENCYRVTDYKHPFDTYDGQDVIIFEEFRSSLKCGDMLCYLDGYPLLLPCRYFNRQACYSKVFILSNIPPDSQYVNLAENETLKAFYRRINSVEYIDKFGHHSIFSSVDDYIHRYDWVNTVIEDF